MDWYSNVVEVDLIDFVITGEGDDGFDGNAWTVHLNKQKTDTSLLFNLSIGANQAKNMISILRMSGP